MKLTHIALTILLSAVVAFGVVKITTPTETTTEAKKETAFKRVMRTKTLRCGYIIWAPFLSQDPATKKMSGIVYDYVTAVAKELGWKVKWAEETGWGIFSEGLRTNRYDAMCMPVYETGLRAEEVLMTTALYNDGLYAFTRADDMRFDESLNKINNPDVSISLVDGEAVGEGIKRNMFPLAKISYVPQMVDQGAYLMEVATRKADVGFASPYAIHKYNEGAPHKLKLLGHGKPVSLYGNSLATRLGEYDLKFAFDSAIHALFRNGTAKRIIEKHKQFGFLMPTEY